jgi:CubicO group peptidase (beta-lactamase class C family)
MLSSMIRAGFRHLGPCLGLTLALLLPGPLAATPDVERAFILGTLPTSAPSDSLSRVDEIFRAFDSARSPGCAVGVARNGQTLLERAWGMADLEHRVANESGTIFEAGSVSKQFTVAAIVLLALDGEISLEDDVRDHIPELPDYGETITLRHMITHTSGLRDWGHVAAFSGWGRPERTHDHDHVVDIASRQSALNFMPGEAYSYSNTGFNLLAVIVERVTDQSFADFSRERLFTPLGLHDTQWRDDYRRIVPGRASAYSPSENGFVINRPIEHVHGNGGLLTTVSDLLRWNEHLRTGTLGAEFMTQMHTRGVLNNGEEIHYAGGLQFGSQNGVERISHTGATSGYRAYLALFPQEELSVTVLCNTSNANPGALGGQVSAVFLPDPPEGAEEPEDPAQEDTEASPWEPTAEDLSAFAGTYYSDDAEVTLRVVVEDGELVILRRPSDRFPLTPSSQDATFEGSLGEIRFIRDDTRGPATQFSVSQARVHDMRFVRVDP